MVSDPSSDLMIQGVRSADLHSWKLESVLRTTDKGIRSDLPDIHRDHLLRLRDLPAKLNPKLIQ
jgi:hypothetical protein